MAAALLGGCGLLLGGCGGHAASVARARPAPAVAPVQVISGFSRPAGRHVALPSPAWVVSFDVRGRMVVRGAGSGAILSLAGAGAGAGRAGGGWRHVEATDGSLSVDGRVSSVRPGRAMSLRFSGPGEVRALIVSAASDRAALLLHRLAELHARVPLGSFPEGADVANRIHYGNTYWTSGFWPGALWQAAALEPSGGLFSGWALATTVAHFGHERGNTHDVGFQYGESSLAAFQALCSGPARAGSVRAGATLSGGSGAGARFGASLCDRLRQSVLSAADELEYLAGTNARAGTIPTNATSGDTIIDSMMNLAILPWASRVTGKRAYVRLASRHAHTVASLLVRADGSTAQSVNFDRATGRVLFVSTHQGLSDRSTWSRGQGWAVYGFSATAAQLHDKSLLRVALRTAGYVARHLPAGGVPRWDYDAPAGAPVDVSAGVITAAGLFHLASACRALPGVCGSPSRWVTLGRRMLAGALRHASPAPPLGLLRDQVLNHRGQGCWCNGGELIFGLTYGLEGLKLS